MLVSRQFKSVLKSEISLLFSPCVQKYFSYIYCFSVNLITCPLCQGERSFFLQPGEHLEHGIQDVYVLSEEEGLVLRAVEAFNDTEEVRRDLRGREVFPFVELLLSYFTVIGSAVSEQ